MIEVKVKPTGYLDINKHSLPGFSENDCAGDDALIMFQNPLFFTAFLPVGIYFNS
jgi:hypothetical protein